MITLHPGDVFAYQTRPEEPESTLKILMVEDDTAHIELRDISVSLADGVVVHHMAHMPILLAQLEQSIVGESIGREPVGESWREGYESYLSNGGAPFIVPVAEAIGIVAKISQKLDSNSSEPPENMESYEGVQYQVASQPMTKKMRTFIAINLPPNDPSNPDLTKINCWKGLEGVFHYAYLPADWALQQFVYYTLVEKQGIDQAIASVFRESARDTNEIANDFFEVTPQKSVPTLGAMMADFMDPRTEAKFNRVLDALQAMADESLGANGLIAEELKTWSERDHPNGN